MYINNNEFMSLPYHERIRISERGLSDIENGAVRPCGRHNISVGADAITNADTNNYAIVGVATSAPVPLPVATVQSSLQTSHNTTTNPYISRYEYPDAELRWNHGNSSAHGHNSVECGVCVPSGFGNDVNDDSNRVFRRAYNIGMFQFILEMCWAFLALGFINLISYVGFWLFFSFLISLTGLCVALCCCPSESGWNYSFKLTSVAYTIRFLLAFVCFAVLLTTEAAYNRVAVCICELCRVVNGV